MKYKLLVFVSFNLCVNFILSMYVYCCFPVQILQFIACKNFQKKVWLKFTVITVIDVLIFVIFSLVFIHINNIVVFHIISVYPLFWEENTTGNFQIYVKRPWIHDLIKLNKTVITHNTIMWLILYLNLESCTWNYSKYCIPPVKWLTHTLYRWLSQWDFYRSEQWYRGHGFKHITPQDSFSVVIPECCSYIQHTTRPLLPTSTAIFCQFSVVFCI